jgi:coproporphyrinogen III oxidase
VNPAIQKKKKKIKPQKKKKKKKKKKKSTKIPTSSEAHSPKQASTKFTATTTNFILSRHHNPIQNLHHNTRRTTIDKNPNQSQP